MKSSNISNKRSGSPMNQSDSLNTNNNNNVSSNNSNNQDDGGTVNRSIAYLSFAIQHNNHLIEYCRTSMSALAGSTAGIIGLTSFYGFAFYLIMVLIFWLMIMTKADYTNYKRYFTSPLNVLTNGFMSGLTTYVLFWTFLYGMVHVY